MITYRNQLKNKIDSLQKLINEINESGLEGINIREGVIVDMTVDNVNANSITTNILKVNNDVNLKNLSVDDLSVVNTITSKNAIIKAFKDLQDYKLIEVVRQGQGKPNRLYVLDYEVSEDGTISNYAVQLYFTITSF